MAFSEDLDPFLADFGQSVTLDGAAVTGVFDAAYTGADAGIGQATTMPALTLKTAAVPASPVGKTVVVASVNYKVAEHQPDGTGVSRLLLERAA